MLNFFSPQLLGALIDRTIGIFSPKTELKRRMIRTGSNNIRAYDAATKGRRGAGWRSVGKGPKDGLCGLSTLRERSRDLVRNNGYAKKAVGGIVANTVGTGIQLQFISEGGNNSGQRANKAFKKWSESTRCDFYKVNTFNGLQTLVMRTLVESGEVLVRRRRLTSDQAKGGIPLEIQVMETDFIDESKDTLIESGHQTVAGVEFDTEGRRVAYHIRTAHPSIDPFAKTIRISSDDIIHLYRCDRSGQIRGIPWGASVMLNLHDLDSYEDAELQRRRIAACFAGFVKTPAGEEADINGMSESTALPLVDGIEPGGIEYLPEGASMDFAIPPNVTGYDEYSVSMLHKIGAGFEVPYSVMTGDYRQVNFSSGRMGWIEFHRLIEEWRWNLFIPRFLDMVVDWWAEAAFLTGINASELERDWTAPRREMIDPVKEGNALIEQVKAGFIAPQEAIRQMGFDPKLNIKLISEWNALIDANKIVLTTDPRQDPKRLTAQNIALANKTE